MINRRTLGSGWSLLKAVLADLPRTTEVVLDEVEAQSEKALRLARKGRRLAKNVKDFAKVLAQDPEVTVRGEDGKVR